MLRRMYGCRTLDVKRGGFFGACALGGCGGWSCYGLDFSRQPSAAAAKNGRLRAQALRAAKNGRLCAQALRAAKNGCLRAQALRTAGCCRGEMLADDCAWKREAVLEHFDEND